MLNYSDVLRTHEGIVTFDQQSARYVPTNAGIYQIIVLPFSFAHEQQDKAISTYLNALTNTKLDHRENLNTKMDISEHGIEILLKRTSKHYIPSLKISDGFIRKAASFFPPIYIGKSINLRQRFNDHCRGINSDIIELLVKYDLKTKLCFFKWHRCENKELDTLETLLIQAHRPLLNRQLK